MAALVTVLAACGGDDDGDDGGGDERAETVIAALVAEGATEDEASCFVDALGPDAVERFVSADDDAITGDEAAGALEALEDCGVDVGG